MNQPFASAGSFSSRNATASVGVPLKVLPNGRVSRVDQLKSQPRKPGEASFFYADHHFQYDAVKVLPEIGRAHV